MHTYYTCIYIHTYMRNAGNYVIMLTRYSGSIFNQSRCTGLKKYIHIVLLIIYDHRSYCSVAECSFFSGPETQLSERPRTDSSRYSELGKNYLTSTQLQAVPVLSSLYHFFISFSSFTLTGAPYQIFLQFLNWLSCNFHLVVILKRIPRELRASRHHGARLRVSLKPLGTSGVRLEELQGPSVPVV